MSNETTSTNTTCAPFFGSPATLDAQGPPRLAVVVDTEEEFDWHAPFSRANTNVTAMRHIGRAQRICERFGVMPLYVVDYPVATQPAGFEELRSWADAARCEIGAHLHPWVTPPFEEDVSGRNSFACNLAPTLQDRKVRTLADTIGSAFERMPHTFKAGRYGIGAATLETLEALEFDVDASVNPHMDFRPVDGPDFSAFDARPFWFGARRRMLEVPCTQGFVGWARAVGGPLRRVSEAWPWSTLRAPGVLARLGMVNRVMLSPEGNTLSEMVALTRALLADGLRVFTLSFHSPSVEPGHTPYVQSQQDLEAFLARLEQYLEFFFGPLSGRASTPEGIRRELLDTHTTHA
jgi:hypothetical protein